MFRKYLKQFSTLATKSQLSVSADSILPCRATTHIGQIEKGCFARAPAGSQEARGSTPPFLPRKNRWIIKFFGFFRHLFSGFHAPDLRFFHRMFYSPIPSCHRKPCLFISLIQYLSLLWYTLANALHNGREMLLSYLSNRNLDNDIKDLAEKIFTTILSEQQKNGEVNSMESKTEALMLKRLSIEYYGQMPWRKKYSYFVSIKDDKVYFSSSYAEENKEKLWSFSKWEVPYSVIEDLSQLARSGGAVGSPEWVNPAAGVMDAHSHNFDLYWADGTHTGPGTAAEQLTSYMNTLGRQCADKLKKAEPSPKGAWMCSCGFSESTGKFCLECGQPRPV